MARLIMSIAILAAVSCAEITSRSESSASAATSTSLQLGESSLNSQRSDQSTSSTSTSGPPTPAPTTPAPVTTPAPDYGCGYACYVPAPNTDSSSSLSLTHKLLIGAAAIAVVSCIVAAVLTLCCVRYCRFCRKAVPLTDPTNDHDKDNGVKINVQTNDPLAAPSLLPPPPAATTVHIDDADEDSTLASVDEAARRLKEEAGRVQYCTALQQVTVGRVIQSQEIHAAVIVATEPVVPR